MEPGDELAPRQRVAVEALARGATLADAARKAGASMPTLFAWRQREPFGDALREAQDALFSDARGELRAATADAVRRLREIVTDRDASASARVRAALGVLAHVQPTQGVEELEERISRLEESQASRANGEARRWAS